jgi:hypothetical protein
MGRYEKIVLADPPARRAPAVIARKIVAERELSELRLQIPECALAVAEGKPGGRENLAALYRQIAAVAFEIEHNAKARELATALDEQALVGWKAKIQELPPEELLAGLTRDQCCGFCSADFCVITGADPLAGPCAHPVLVGALELNRYQDNPKIRAVYAAACAKLGLRSRAA